MSAALHALARRQTNLDSLEEGEEEERGKLLRRRTTHAQMINRPCHYRNRTFAAISHEVLLRAVTATVDS